MVWCVLGAIPFAPYRHQTEPVDEGVERYLTMSPDLINFFLNASVVSAFALYQIIERQSEAKRRQLEQKEDEAEWKRRLELEREDRKTLMATVRDVTVAMTRLLERSARSHGDE